MRILNNEVLSLTNTIFQTAELQTQSYVVQAIGALVKARECHNISPSRPKQIFESVNISEEEVDSRKCIDS